MPAGLLAAAALAGAAARELGGRLVSWWRIRRAVARELDVIPPQFAGSRQLRRAFARGFAARMLEHDKRARRRGNP